MLQLNEVGRVANWEPKILHLNEVEGLRIGNPKYYT